jgi:hypothetical protein
MRVARGRLALYLSALDKRCVSFGAALLLSTATLGLAFLGGGADPVEGQQYSAYKDPGKPAISFVLSKERNVEEFQREFGLNDAQMERVLAIVREENEKLAREYAESERVVEANEERSRERVRARIAASDYTEEIRGAVARTKSSIRALLPVNRRSDLKDWVDAKFAQESREFSEAASSAAYQASGPGGRGVRCRVFATQYHGYTRYEVALPHKKLKKQGGYRIRIRRGERRVSAPVREVGPWNIRDNYWQSRRYRDMWDDLPRCKPEAQVAYFRNYHRGRDQFGRKVLNPAGVDLTPRVARRLGLKKYENAWVYVRYPWVRR